MFPAQFLSWIWKQYQKLTIFLNGHGNVQTKYYNHLIGQTHWRGIRYLISSSLRMLHCNAVIFPKEDICCDAASNFFMSRDAMTTLQPWILNMLNKTQNLEYLSDISIFSGSQEITQMGQFITYPRLAVLWQWLFQSQNLPEPSQSPRYIETDLTRCRMWTQQEKPLWKNVSVQK